MIRLFTCHTSFAYLNYFQALIWLHAHIFYTVVVTTIPSSKPLKFINSFQPIFSIKHYYSWKWANPWRKKTAGVRLALAKVHHEVVAAGAAVEAVQFGAVATNKKAEASRIFQATVRTNSKSLNSIVTRILKMDPTNLWCLSTQWRVHRVLNPAHRVYLTFMFPTRTCLLTCCSSYCLFVSRSFLSRTWS